MQKSPNGVIIISNAVNTVKMYARGALMAKNSNVRRISDKKKNKPKIRFNIWVMIIIFALSFAGCFVLYMAAANMDENFFSDEFSTVVEESSGSAGLNESEDSEAAETTESVQQSAVVNNPVPVSAAADISYLENCCLVTDSTLIAMKDHTDFKDVIGNAALSAASVNSTKIESSYGTVTAYETLKIKKPMNVYIMLGSDIGVSSVDDMISSYMTFVSNLKASLPEMKIYIMQLPPVYADSETVTNAMIDEYNSRLLSLANSLGVYCIDTNLEMKTNEGSLKDEYWSEETGTLNESAYSFICGYILTHTV